MVVRIAVIGTGFGARGHAPAFQTAKGAAVVSIVSQRPERAAAAARELQIPHHGDDISSMLGTVRPDLVCIATPPATQLAIVRQVAERGVGVVCEKPMGRSLDEARAIADTVERHGVFGAVCFEFRYAPATQRLSSLLSSGLIGAPRFAFATEMSDLIRRPRGTLAPWILSDAMGGGIRGTHTVDLLLRTMGQVHDVSAVRRSFAPPVDPHDAAPDALAYLLQFVNGTVGLVAISPAVGEFDKRIEFWGDAGQLVLMDDEMLSVRTGGQTSRDVPADNRHDAAARSHERIGRFMDAFAQDIVVRFAAGAPGYPSVHDAVEVMRVVESARLSASSGLRVEISAAAG